MRLVAVLKARYLAMLELDQLNASGKIRFSDCVGPLVERYGFEVFPQKPEDFDLDNKGVKFQSGKTKDAVIDALVIYSGAIYLDTLSSTKDSAAILSDMLEWGRDKLGLSYEPTVVRKHAYISDIVFDTDFPILANFSSPLQKLSEKTSLVTGELFNGLTYQPMYLKIGHDPNIRKHDVAGLTIQHRASTLFSENRYFSEAPLPTDLHIKFLEEFEADVLNSQK